MDTAGHDIWDRRIDRQPPTSVCRCGVVLNRSSRSALHVLVGCLRQPGQILVNHHLDALDARAAILVHKARGACMWRRAAGCARERGRGERQREVVCTHSKAQLAHACSSIWHTHLPGRRAAPARARARRAISSTRRRAPCSGRASLAPARHAEPRHKEARVSVRRKERSVWREGVRRARKSGPTSCVVVWSSALVIVLALEF